MSQRSPMNKRTQNHEVTGATRKSASSAKPARQAASSVRVEPASSKSRRAKLEAGESLAGLSRAEKRVRKQQRRMMQDRIMAATNYLLKGVPEYPGRRHVWWAFLAVGIVAIIVAWVTLYAKGNGGATSGFSTVSVVSLVIAYAAIIGGFIYDYVRIRPLRNEARIRAEGMSESKLIALLEQADNEKEARRKKK